MRRGSRLVVQPARPRLRRLQTAHSHPRERVGSELDLAPGRLRAEMRGILQRSPGLSHRLPGTARHVENGPARALAQAADPFPDAGAEARRRERAMAHRARERVQRMGGRVGHVLPQPAPEAEARGVPLPGQRIERGVGPGGGDSL